MSKYSAVYKCHLCGSLYQLPNKVELSPRDLPAVLGKFVRTQSLINNPYLYDAPQYLPCKCPDGSGGLAQFIGFKKVSD